MAKVNIFKILTSLFTLLVGISCGENGPFSANGGSDPIEGRDQFTILSCIMLLVVLYLLSKYLASQHEPNICVYGKVQS